MLINTNKLGELPHLREADRFQTFETSIRSLGRKESGFVEKIITTMSKIRSRRRTLRSTGKFKERIGTRTSRDERRRRSSFIPSLYKARKSKLAIKLKTIKKIFIKEPNVKKEDINSFMKLWNELEDLEFG